MKDGRKVKVEELLFPQLIQMVGEAFQYDEAVTRTALSPVVAAMRDDFVNPIFRFGILARTATLFLTDYEDFLAAIRSADEPPLLPQLPPLPYPRIAVECAQEMVWTLGDKDGAVAELELFAINEAQQGEEWNVALLLAGADEYVQEIEGDGSVLARRQLLIYTLKSDGQVWQLSTDPDRVKAEWGTELPTYRLPPTGSLFEWLSEIEEQFIPDLWETHYEADHRAAQILRKLPIEFAHLVNARGVTVEPVDVPRPQRRRFERHKLVHPRLYFVKIGGELTDSYPGHGDREYHCRWLVRGHWRHFQDGSRTWVRPYIKGPAGAPWRGRPIYVIEPSEE